jgi:hypothetical protein
MRAADRRATDILEQQRVVERVALVAAQLQLRRDTHADQARALGLADGMPFGHVERMRQRGDDLRSPHFTQTALQQLHLSAIGSEGCPGKSEERESPVRSHARLGTLSRCRRSPPSSCSRSRRSR